MAITQKEIEIVREAKERLKEVQDWEGVVRPLMVEDKRFDNGEQWDSEVSKQRKFESRPTLTVPRTNQFTDRLKNEQRQNKPSVKVRPVGDADKKPAKYRQGLIRHIQYQSKAQLAYQKAFNDAVTCGRGHWLVTSEYVSDDSFDQNVIIDTIENAMNVYMDPHHKEPDYSDCKWGMILERMPRKDYIKEYPNSTQSNFANTQTDGNWATEDYVQLARYYCQKKRKRTLLFIVKDGEARKVYRDEIKDTDYETEVKPYVQKKRKVEYKTWWWYKLNGSEILDSRELKGITQIPIATVVGKETVIDGRWNCKGIIRDLIDSQKMYNFWVSQESELISLAPRAPFIGVVGPFEGIPQWADANQTNYSYLEYNPISANGTLAPPPQRQQMAQIPMGIVNAKQSIIDDMKAITGMYDAALGQQSNETSGKAILARQMQGETANYHFIDNYSNALKHTGRVLNEMLPIYYDTERVVTIMQEDDETDQISLGGQDDNGERISLGDGQYDVVCDVGPSYSTRRQEGAETAMELMRSVPVVAQTGADVAIKQLDIPDADTLAERAKKAIAMQFGPDMVAPVSEDNNEVQMMGQQLQQTSQQLQQLGQQNQQLQEQLQKLDQMKVQSESQKQNNEAQRVQIEAQKVKNDYEIEQKKLELQGMTSDLENETKLTINSDNIQANMLKDASQAQRDANAPKVEAPKEGAKSTPMTVNIDNGSGVRVSKVTKDADGNYTVESKDV